MTKNARNRKLYNAVASVCCLIFSNLPHIFIDTVSFQYNLVSLAHSVIFLIKFKGCILRRWSLNRAEDKAV
jgi:hypothetical protein